VPFYSQVSSTDSAMTQITKTGKSASGFPADPVGQSGRCAYCARLAAAVKESCALATWRVVPAILARSASFAWSLPHTDTSQKPTRVTSEAGVGGVSEKLASHSQGNLVVGWPEQARAWRIQAAGRPREEGLLLAGLRVDRQ
jgi:hypothetical protein